MTSAAASSEPSIIPAQLSYLAIYNPSLGPTDETFDQQLVCYYSRADAQAKHDHIRSGKQGDFEHGKEEANERLRRIGLAQGLTGFARTFSDGAPVDSAETEKSRLVLHELEENWWILVVGSGKPAWMAWSHIDAHAWLQSIDLTRIPISPTTARAASNDKSQSRSTPPQYEYSSREVSPSNLLLQQVLQAHAIFTLHHGPSLNNLFDRLQRDRFCSTLDRFWTRFARTWDVLLHGNPAVDVLSGIKLASGGELGFGVGEEEWGSSERGVLEDMIGNTEGLVDVVVARFGDEATSDDTPAHILPWAGGGNIPSVNDGIIFGGVNGISRASLQSISLWMRHIYTYGDNAYGVRDNPHRERRRRRRRNVSEQVGSVNIRGRSTSHVEQDRKLKDVGPQRANNTTAPVSDLRPTIEHRTTSHDFATGISTPLSTDEQHIPPPIVSAAEAALNEATRKADAKLAKQTPAGKTEDDPGSTLGIPDQYLKYLTFGLSTLAKPSSKPQRQEISRASSAPNEASQNTKKGQRRNLKSIATDDDDSDTPMLAMLEPMPDGNVLHARVARQKGQENQGHFIIGLKGDLDSIPEDYDAEVTEGSSYEYTEGLRTVLRTLYVNRIEVDKKVEGDSTPVSTDRETSTPARLRVIIYARRPFIYCFLFEQRTDSLGYARFYRSLHRNLTPIHKQLLNSTQPSNVADRVQAAQLEQETTLSSGSDQDMTPVLDIMYDPVRLTVHASIPNIPDPGSLLAAEGALLTNLGKHPTTWTRLEALNVHSTILSTLASSKKHPEDNERTSKTSRGWWVVWISLQPSDTRGDNAERQSKPAVASNRIVADDRQIAFVVRKATASSTSHKPSSSSNRATSGVWNQLTSTLRASDGDSSANKIASLDSGGGIGFDARRYVESLLSLNR